MSKLNWKIVQITATSGVVYGLDANGNLWELFAPSNRLSEPKWVLVVESGRESNQK